MAKGDDWLSGIRAPLAVWIMALVTGGAVFLPKAPGSGTGENAAGAAGQQDQASTPAYQDSALATARPVIRLLADFSGVRLDPDAARAAITLRDNALLRDTPLVVEALDTLVPLIGPTDPGRIPTRGQTGTPRPAAGRGAPTLSRDEAIRVLRSYVVPDGDGAAADIRAHLSRVLDYFEKGPDDYRSLKRIADELARQKVGVEFVIATLPDYVDSQVRRLFDVALAGIQQAAATLGYTLDRFYLPSVPDAQPPMPRALHEEQPGAIVFRASSPSTGPQLLVVLVATETPTAGLHHRAFQAATELVAGWHEAACANGSAVEGCGSRPTLRVLGPTFSGTSDSLRLAMARLKTRPGAGTPATVQIVTGSATAPENGRTIAAGWPDAVKFGTTIASNDDVLNALASYLGGLRREWGRGRGVALLVESNTVFGQSLARSPTLPALEMASAGKPSAATQTGGQESVPLPDAVRIRFPLHISRLRSRVAAAPASGGRGTSRPRITLEDPSTSPTDLLPAVTPELTSAQVDVALSNVLASLRRERVSAVGILATDARDHLFLASEIRRVLPNAQMFGTQADLLYLNTDYVPFLRGTIIASTYPLFNETQLATPVPWGERRRAQFGVSTEQGIYNAFLALTAGVRQCTGGSFTCIDPSAPVLDYGVSGDTCRDQPCAPPVWLSVVGNDTLWPLAADSNAGARDAQLLRFAQAPHTDRAPDVLTGSPTALTGWWALGLFALLTLLCWLHGIMLLIAERHRSQSRRPRPIHAAPEDGPAGSDGPTQPALPMAGVVGRWANRRRADWRFGAFSAMHFLPSQVLDQGERRGTDAGAGSRHRVTMAERCADQAYDAALFVLFMALLLASVWSYWWAWLWLGDWRAAGRGGYVLLGAAAAVTAMTATCLIAALWTLAGRLLERAADRRRHRASAPHRPMRPRRSSRWLLNGIGWGVVATSCLVPLLIVAARSMSASPSHGLAFTRVASLSSGVSPTPPVLLVIAVLYLTSIWNTRRLNMHRYCLPNGWWIGDLLSGGSCEFKKQLRRAALEFAPWQTSGVYVLLPVAAALAALTAGSRHGFTVEGLWFTRWFWWGSLVALVAMSRVAARAASQGKVLKEALDRLASHPISGAYKVVATRPFDWTLSASPLPRSALAPLIDEVRLLQATTFLVDDKADRLDVDEREAVMASAQALLEEAKPWRHHRVPAMRTPEWRKLLDLGSDLTRALETHYWAPASRLRRAEHLPPAAGSAATPFDRAELIVAFALAFVIRSLLARVVSSLSTGLIGFALLLTAHLGYAFQGRAFWVSLDLACLSAAALIACYTLIQFEKDHILSVLWRTDPGHINWTGGLLYRIAVTVALPILLFVASMFPEVGGSLVTLLEPLQKALP